MNSGNKLHFAICVLQFTAAGAAAVLHHADNGKGAAGRQQSGRQEWSHVEVDREGGQTGVAA